MKRLFLTILLISTYVFYAEAQSLQQGNSVQSVTESEISALSEMGTEVQIDSSLYGRDIFSVLPQDMIVIQGQEVRTALNNQVIRNEGRSFSGFRIRIFIDSKREAREASLNMLKRFNQRYPKVPAYRTYAAPNFKVSVGNFRNRVEAEAFLKLIKDEFTEAFIVRERFKYPSIGSPDLSSEANESTESIVSE